MTTNETPEVKKLHATSDTWGFYVCPTCGQKSASGRYADLVRGEWKNGHRDHLNGQKFQFHTAFHTVAR